MKLDDFKKRCVYQAHISLPDGAWVDVREPTLGEFAVETLDPNDSGKIKKLLFDLFPKCVVASSLKDSDGKEADTTEVGEAILSSVTLANEVIGEWAAFPWGCRRKKKEN